MADDIPTIIVKPSPFPTVGSTSANLEGRRGSLQEEPVGDLGLVRRPDGSIGTPNAGGLAARPPLERVVQGLQTASDAEAALGLPDREVKHFQPLGPSAPTQPKFQQGLGLQSPSDAEGLLGIQQPGLGAGLQTPSDAEAALGLPSASTPKPPPAQAQPVPGDSEIRIKLSPLHPADVFQGGVINALKDIGGIMFPYTPTINFSQQVNYMDLQLVHSNTDYAAYTRTPSVTITITGKFTVQNQAEGVYALGCLHFLRTVSKSYFGKLDGNKAGLPPPILLLNGYGNHMFNQLRVILKSHSWSFDDQIDGIVILTQGGVARLPALFNVTCELTIVQTPQRMREQFSFDKFASGALMQPGLGWI